MKKISCGCTVIGITSIVLSICGLFLYPAGEVAGYNLPFQFLLISFKMGSIAVPKLAIFVDTLPMFLFDYIFSVILIISGIGTIWIKPWGKIFSFIYAMTIIFLFLISMPVIICGYITMYNEMIKQSSLSLFPVFVGGWAYFLTSLGALLYPVVLLVFFSRPKIKEKFSTKR